MKEKVISILKKLGFTPEEIGEDYGIGFEYEELNMVYLIEEDGIKTLTFMVPAIYEVTEDNLDSVYKTVTKLIATMRYIQPVISNDGNVWISYQHYLGDHEPDSELIEHMIRVLSFATQNFFKTINNLEDDEQTID